MRAMQRRLAELEALVAATPGRDDGRVVVSPPAEASRNDGRPSPPSPPSPAGTVVIAASEASPRRARSSRSSSSTHSANSRDPGIITTLDDNWRRKAGRPSPLLSVLRELSIGALGEYIGATSQITMGHIISSMACAYDQEEETERKGGQETTTRVSESGAWETLSPKSANVANAASKSDLPPIDIASLPSAVADKLLRGYIVHISTRWPVMHTPYLRHLHETRSSLSDVYEYVLRLFDMNILF